MRYLITAIFLLQGSLLDAQQRPLVTERAETVSQGHVLLDVGIEYLQNAIFPFSGLEGDLTRAGVVGFRLGVADNVEIQVQGTLQNTLSIQKKDTTAPNASKLNFSGNSTNDVGDFILATKVRFLEEKGNRPALAFRFGMELPNASNEAGLGNDETNVFGSLLLEKEFEKITLLTNLGVAILGDPVTAGAQDDLFSYGVAALYDVHPRVRLVGDIYGRTGPGGIGTEEQSSLRLGAQIQAAHLYWDVGLFSGLTDTEPDFGLIVGVSKEFRLFNW